MEKPTFKVWISKSALTSGIREATVYQGSEDHVVCERADYGRLNIFQRNQWHKTCDAPGFASFCLDMEGLATMFAPVHTNGFLNRFPDGHQWPSLKQAISEFIDYLNSLPMVR